MQPRDDDEGEDRSKRKRGTQEQIRSRREVVEERLVKGHRVSSIVRYMARNYGLSTRSVYEDIAAVRREWAREASTVDRDTKRAAYEQQLNEATRLAFDRRKLLQGPDGEVLMDEDGEPKSVPDPDTRAVIRAVDVASRLHGLQTVRVELEVQREVERVLDAIKPHLSDGAWGEVVAAIGVVLKPQTEPEPDPQLEPGATPEPSDA